VDVIESVDNYITALETRAETARTARSALLHDLLSNPGPNWTETTLGDVANLVAGPAFRSETFHHATEGFRLLRGMNLGPSGTRWEETFHWPEDQIAGFEKYALEKEDICVTMDATFTSDGAIRAAILTSSDLPALVNQRVMRIRSMGSTLQTFLWLVIRSSITTTHLRGSQTGAFAPHVSGKDISSISFVLPPLEEQQRIVGVIESVDSSVAALEIQIASARTIRAAVLSDLLSGNHEIPASYDQLLGAA
jgi:type I restriction enzyme S subunit